MAHCCSTIGRFVETGFHTGNTRITRLSSRRFSYSYSISKSRLLVVCNLRNQAREFRVALQIPAIRRDDGSCNGALVFRLYRPVSDAPCYEPSVRPNFCNPNAILRVSSGFSEPTIYGDCAE